MGILKKLDDKVQDSEILGIQLSSVLMVHERIVILF